MKDDDELPPYLTLNQVANLANSASSISSGMAYSLSNASVSYSALYRAATSTPPRIPTTKIGQMLMVQREHVAPIIEAFSLRKEDVDDEDEVRKETEDGKKITRRFRGRPRKKA